MQSAWGLVLHFRLVLQAAVPEVVQAEVPQLLPHAHMARSVSLCLENRLPRPLHLQVAQDAQHALVPQVLAGNMPPPKTFQDLLWASSPPVVPVGMPEEQKKPGQNGTKDLCVCAGCACIKHGTIAGQLSFSARFGKSMGMLPEGARCGEDLLRGRTCSKTPPPLFLDGSPR